MFHYCRNGTDTVSSPQHSPNGSDGDVKQDINDSGTVSPSSLILTNITTQQSPSNFKMSRRASSADSQSSADSRGHRRYWKIKQIKLNYSEK